MKKSIPNQDEESPGPSFREEVERMPIMAILEEIDKRQESRPRDRAGLKAWKEQITILMTQYNKIAKEPGFNLHSI